MKSNWDVACAFVAGKAADSSNLHAIKCNPGIALLSYSTEIARIVDERLYITTQKYSPTTNRHMSDMRGAWGKVHGYHADNSDMFYMSDTAVAGSDMNLTHELRYAARALETTQRPRIQMKTRSAAFGTFRASVARAYREITMLPSPAYLQPTARSVAVLEGYRALAMGIPNAELTPADLITIEAVLALQKS